MADKDPTAGRKRLASIAIIVFGVIAILTILYIHSCTELPARFSERVRHASLNDCYLNLSPSNV